MGFTFPKDIQGQQDYINGLEQEILSLETITNAFVGEFSVEPTQGEWENLWVARGNALPLPVGQEFVWWDGDQPRGIYQVLNNDLLVTVTPDKFMPKTQTLSGNVTGFNIRPLVRWYDNTRLVALGKVNDPVKLPGVTDSALFLISMDGSLSLLKEVPGFVEGYSLALDGVLSLGGGVIWATHTKPIGSVRTLIRYDEVSDTVTTLPYPTGLAETFANEGDTLYGVRGADIIETQYPSFVETILHTADSNILTIELYQGHFYYKQSGNDSIQSVPIAGGVSEEVVASFPYAMDDITPDGRIRSFREGVQWGLVDNELQPIPSSENYLNRIRTEFIDPRPRGPKDSQTITAYSNLMPEQGPSWLDPNPDMVLHYAESSPDCKRVLWDQGKGGGGSNLWGTLWVSSAESTGKLWRLNTYSDPFPDFKLVGNFITPDDSFGSITVDLENALGKGYEEYDHLMVVLSVATAGDSAALGGLLQLNGDTTAANYQTISQLGQGTTLTYAHTNGTQAGIYWIPSVYVRRTPFVMCFTDIHEDTPKQVNFLGGGSTSWHGTNQRTSMGAGVWSGTSAIRTLTFLPRPATNPVTWLSGSEFRVIAIKGKSRAMRDGSPYAYHMA